MKSLLASLEVKISLAILLNGASEPSVGNG
jgi:hypothetical protein